MMKPIIEYTDFRKFMRDFYEERKRCSAFSWREFSKIAGFSSPSYMKVVCDGNSKLSRIGVERTGAAMGLAGFEMDYFRAMVKFGQADVESKKVAAYEEMLSIAKVYKVRVLAPLMPGATPGELAKMCYPEVSAQEVQESLAFLTKAGLLKKTEGKLVQSETSVKGSNDATRLAMRGMHRMMSQLATPALELPVEERNFSGVTMGLSRESYSKIENLLDECRRKILLPKRKMSNRCTG